MQLSWQVATGGVVVTVVGEVDMETAPRLDAGLAEAAEQADAATPLLLDLSGTTFLGSAGLQVLATWHERCRAAGSALVLVAPHRAVTQVLRITGLHSVLTMASTVPVPAAPGPDDRPLP